LLAFFSKKQNDYDGIRQETPKKNTVPERCGGKEKTGSDDIILIIILLEIYII
jgi:hypothetical protein